MKQTFFLSIAGLAFFFLTGQSKRLEKAVLIADSDYWTLSES